MKFLYKVIYGLIISICFNWNLNAQTIKYIEVSGNTPYVDHIALMQGTDDMDLLVKIAFKEPDNSLTISLISYRKLFVPQSDIRYSQVVRHSKLRPNKLPYVVEYDDQTEFILTKSLKKSIAPKRKHIFNRWIEYEGLQPQPTNYKMVNDYIEQTFDILNKEADVSITLRDILVMAQLPSHKKTKYELFFQTDLDRKYEIHIKRDPCFGKEEAIKISATQVENVKAGFLAFNKQFGRTSDFNTPGSEKIFNEMKDILLQQFPKNEYSNECPEIQSNIDIYNSYVDSIRQMQAKIIHKIESQKRAKLETLDFSADYILTMARKIDNNVNRWLLSSDNTERKDLETACDQVINLIRSHVIKATIISESQKAAINIFNEAANYFHRTCTKE